MRNHSSNILPSPQFWNKPFVLCPLDKVRVVLVGQDPYPQKGYATGLAFANFISTNKISPSLEVLRERIYTDFYIPNNKPLSDFDITLESWANQGILLLNSALSVEEGRPGSHANIWFPVMASLLHNLSLQGNLIFILLGSTAHLLGNYIVNTNNVVLKYKHPAYFVRINHSFICDGFLQINKILAGNNQPIINF